MFWRNPSAAFFNFVLPLLFLALFGAIYAGSQEDLDVLVPGVAGMSVVSTTFVALAHNLVFLREQGVLKRLRGTPMPAGAYLGALAAHAVTNAVIQLGIVVVAGRLLFGTGWRSEEHTSELQSRQYLVCRLLLEKKKQTISLFQLIYISSFPLQSRIFQIH